MRGFKIIKNTEPFTLDEVMEFVDSIDMNDMDRHQLKCMIADVADQCEVKTTKDVQTVIDALRCSYSEEYSCNPKCPYFVMCSPEDKEAFMKEHEGIDIDDDFFGSCDADTICGDAATLLEGKQTRFRHVILNNGNHALLDSREGRVYHSYMTEDFMARIGQSYKVVDE